MKKILLLEDEASIRSFIVINLRRAGYDVIEAETGEEALERLRANPDTKVALLDIMLPWIDGFEVCRRIRATNTKIGIIMLTARSQEMDKVTGLMTGADDYVTKPFGVRELMARVKANLRKSVVREETPEQAPAGKGNFGKLDINPDRYEVRKDGRIIDLTVREFELLKFLAMNPNIVFSREKLFEKIWGYDYVGDSATVMVHINRIREKIEDDPKNPKILETVWGAGYRLNK